MKNLLGLFLFICCLPLNANQIIYPWRACPAIVTVNNELDILYNNVEANPVDSVILEGPYFRIVLPLEEVLPGHYIYDNYTGEAVNSRIRVRIPDHTPEDLYSLIIKCGQQTDVSPRSVKVIKEFRDKYKILHISDLHLSRQWVGSPEEGYAKELELLDRFIDMANVFAPDFILVTGDIIHDYTRHHCDSTGWGGVEVRDIAARPGLAEKLRNYFEGSNGFRGVYGFNAPVFSLPGNHDFYGVTAREYPAKSLQWNRNLGKRVYGFSYGSTRVIVTDDFLGDPEKDSPKHAPMSGLQGQMIKEFLDKEGMGQFRIWAKHSPSNLDTLFMNRHRIHLILHGHHHQPFQEYIGETPTLTSRPGTLTKSGEVSDWEKVLGFFRIFTVEGDQLGFTEPLRFCTNPVVPYDQLELNFNIRYSSPNDGRSERNEVSLDNRFTTAFENCSVRFIMPKGKYQVKGGEIYQIIETDGYTIVDISTDVDAVSAKNIAIVPQ